MDFKPIRNKLRTFTSESITNEILILLKQIESQKVQKKSSRIACNEFKQFNEKLFL